jgi:anaphase-promoting complex subunit 1
MEDRLVCDSWGGEALVLDGNDVVVVDAASLGESRRFVGLSALPRKASGGEGVRSASLRWSWFPSSLSRPEDVQRFVAVLQTRTTLVLIPDSVEGNMHDDAQIVGLPFEVRSVHRLRTGLLLEREQASGDQLGLFFLPHPLSEPLPVKLRGTSPMPVSWDCRNDVVVGTVDVLGAHRFVATFHRRQKAHQLWAVTFSPFHDRVEESWPGSVATLASSSTEPRKGIIRASPRQRDAQPLLGGGLGFRGRRLVGNAVVDPPQEGGVLEVLHETLEAEEKELPELSESTFGMGLHSVWVDSGRVMGNEALRQVLPLGVLGQPECFGLLALKGLEDEAVALLLERKRLPHKGDDDDEEESTDYEEESTDDESSHSIVLNPKGAQSLAVTVVDTLSAALSIAPACSCGPFLGARAGVPDGVVLTRGALSQVCIVVHKSSFALQCSGRLDTSAEGVLVPHSAGGGCCVWKAAPVVLAPPNRVASAVVSRVGWSRDPVLGALWLSLALCRDPASACRAQHALSASRAPMGMGMYRVRLEMDGGVVRGASVPAGLLSHRDDEMLVLFQLLVLGLAWGRRLSAEEAVAEEEEVASGPVAGGALERMLGELSRGPVSGGSGTVVFGLGGAVGPWLVSALRGLLLASAEASLLEGFGTERVALAVLGALVVTGVLARRGDAGHACVDWFQDTASRVGGESLLRDGLAALGGSGEADPSPWDDALTAELEASFAGVSRDEGPVPGGLLLPLDAIRYACECISFPGRLGEFGGSRWFGIEGALPAVLEGLWRWEDSVHRVHRCVERGVVERDGWAPGVFLLQVLGGVCRLESLAEWASVSRLSRGVVRELCVPLRWMFSVALPRLRRVGWESGSRMLSTVVRQLRSECLEDESCAELERELERIALQACCESSSRPEVTPGTVTSSGSTHPGCPVATGMTPAVGTPAQAAASAVPPEGDPHDLDGVRALCHGPGRMRFPQDRRLEHCGVLLSSSRAPMLFVDGSRDGAAEELTPAVVQSRTLILGRRTCALPLGRGMMTCGTLWGDAADLVGVPPLTLAARHPRSGAALALDIQNISSRSSGPTSWPEWHNGCAAAMRVMPGSIPARSMRAWVRAHSAIGADSSLGMTPADASGAAGVAAAAAASALGGVATTLGGGRPTYSHGGLLVGMGVGCGALLHLTKPDLYELLSRGHVGVTCGVLAGLAGAAAGTCDSTVHRVLLLHLPCAIPGSLRSLQVPAVAQSTALACLGLLHRQSMNASLVGFFLGQVRAASFWKGSSVMETNAMPAPGEMGNADGALLVAGDAEAYSLSAGIGLGMVMLGHGASAVAKEVGLLDRLSLLLKGGADPQFRPSASSASLPSVRSVSGRVDTTMTAAPAAVALGLAFHRTAHEGAMAVATLPTTLAGLSTVRPDVATLRVLALGLIGWDDVVATKEWVRSTVPLCVRAVVDELRQLEEARSVVARSGGGLKDLVMALAGDDSSDEEGSPDEEGPPDSGARLSRPARAMGIDVALVDLALCREMLCACLTGAAFVLGLRYAGTGNVRARDLLLRLLTFFASLRAESEGALRSVRDSMGVVEGVAAEAASGVSSRPSDVWCEGNTPSFAVLRRLYPSAYTVETARATAAVALGMVMAGRGDALCLRVLRACRRSLESTTDYGHHMAVGMGMGMLFLGGGRATLCRTPTAVAALVMSLLPRWHHGSSDNRAHLQPLRALWGLAVDRRCIETVDAATGHAVSTSAEVEAVETDDEGSRGGVRAYRVVRSQVTVPGLLPELGRIRRVRVACVELKPSVEPAHAAVLVEADWALDWETCEAGHSGGGARAAAIASNRLSQELDALREDVVGTTNVGRALCRRLLERRLRRPVVVRMVSEPESAPSRGSLGWCAAELLPRTAGGHHVDAMVARSKDVCEGDFALLLRAMSMAPLLPLAMRHVLEGQARELERRVTSGVERTCWLPPHWARRGGLAIGEDMAVRELPRARTMVLSSLLKSNAVGDE